MKQLSDFITNWNKNPDTRKENDSAFITLFCELISSPHFDERDVTFDGDGAYFGKQITINVGSTWRMSSVSDLDFEIAYDHSQIVIYTANHNGFWVEPFVSMTHHHPEFFKMRRALYSLLMRVFGLPIAND